MQTHLCYFYLHVHLKHSEVDKLKQLILNKV